MGLGRRERRRVPFKVPHSKLATVVPRRNAPVLPRVRCEIWVRQIPYPTGAAHLQERRAKCATLEAVLFFQSQQRLALARVQLVHVHGARAFWISPEDNKAGGGGDPLGICRRKGQALIDVLDNLRRVSAEHGSRRRG